jgi:tRNA(fMet)-specific endonuclease VapC
VTYIFDSDVLIAIFGNNPRAIRTLQELRRTGVGVSIISHAEVFEGAFGYPDTEAHLTLFRQFLDQFIMLPLTGPIVEIFAHVRSDLRRVGQLIPDMDLLIAATAMDHDAILVTRNLRHFDRITGLRTFRQC